jgi:hypothetical protein
MGKSSFRCRKTIYKETRSEKESLFQKARIDGRWYGASTTSTCAAEGGCGPRFFVNKKAASPKAYRDL